MGGTMRIFASLCLAMMPVDATVGKSTYAMTHPFAFKAWMEKYTSTTENVIQENSTKTCNEWVKLCMGPSCSPQTFQLHSVGAYERNSGSKSLGQQELDFTKAMGGMAKYDPFMELHAAFYTSDLDTYISTFKADSVAYFPSTFTHDKKKYSSITVQVDGSLVDGAGSLLLLCLVGNSSSLLAADPRTHHHDVPRASAASLLRAEKGALSTVGLPGAMPELTALHISWPTSNITAMVEYFEGTLGGTKASSSSANGTSTYYGKLFSTDTLELRWVQSTDATQGPTSVAEWEAYTAALHKKCLHCPNTNNQGFDRLADQHVGGRSDSTSLGLASLDTLVTAQKKSGYGYRMYAGPQGHPDFLYLYGPSGWGFQITGVCSKECGSNVVFYDECTQGTTASCSKDL